MPHALSRTGLLMLAGWLSGLVSAHAEPPSEAPPFILGISTHLMNYERPVGPPLSLAAEAGFNAVKDDVFWSTAEVNRNQLRIIPQWRRYLEQASSLQLERLAILGYSTHFHDNAKPRTPEVTGPFLNYVDYVSRQLGNRVSYYEIWNEWDLQAPRDRQLAQDYAELVRKTVPVIRANTQTAPGTKALILAGAVTPEGMDHGFADHLINSGVLAQLDGLSIHPYVHCADNNGRTPEAWWRWVSDYEENIRNKAGRAIPIYLTEVGWPSHKGACGVSEMTQALYMARIWFLARSIANVKGMWWYDLYNDGADRFDQEHNFGILNEDLSPKPAWTMMRAIAPVVRDFTYQAEASVLSGPTYQLYFSKGQQRVLVAWTVGKPLALDLISHAPVQGPVRLLDTRRAAGGETASEQVWQCADEHCTASVMLDEFPKIIRLTP